MSPQISRENHSTTLFTRTISNLCDAHVLSLVQITPTFLHQSQQLVVNNMVDYIFLYAAVASYVNSCEIMSNHPLNLFDHLLISISINAAGVRTTLHQPSHKMINWSKPVSDVPIYCYASKVHSKIAPLLNVPHLLVQGHI